MLATKVNGLHVCCGEMELTRNVPSKLDDGGFGWRIMLDASDMVIPMKFLRERDAVVAMHSIADLIDWTMDSESLDIAVRPLVNKIRRLMTEALAW